MLRRIAVTGGKGFIGRAVCEHLAQRGIEPVLLDLPEHDVRTLGPGALAGFGHVIHMAGALGTAELFDDVPGAITSNVTGTARVLQAAVNAGCGYTGITMPKVFPSVYMATKQGARELERAFHHSYGLPVSRVRAYNAYGCGQKHGPGHPQKIVPTFATEAWAGRPIPVWGDGEQVVDLVWTGDLGRMIADATRFGGDLTFDGGTGIAMTVNDVARMVLDITGSKAGIQYLPMRRGEISRRDGQPIGDGWDRIVAGGEGWDRLGWQPDFDGQAFADAVESYRAAR